MRFLVAEARAKESLRFFVNVVERVLLHSADGVPPDADSERADEEAGQSISDAVRRARTLEAWRETLYDFLNSIASVV